MPKWRNTENTVKKRIKTKSKTNKINCTCAKNLDQTCFSCHVLTVYYCFVLCLCMPPKITEFEVLNTEEHRFGILENGKMATLVTVTPAPTQKSIWVLCKNEIHENTSINSPFVHEGYRLLWSQILGCLWQTRYCVSQAAHGPCWEIGLRSPARAWASWPADCQLPPPVACWSSPAAIWRGVCAPPCRLSSLLPRDSAYCSVNCKGTPCCCSRSSIPCSRWSFGKVVCGLECF